MIALILYINNQIACLPIVFSGRTHQLRVHCCAVGHPIVGDYTYSLGKDNNPYRMMLHAYLLHIPLPKEPVHVTAPDPFLPHIDPKWAPERLMKTLEGALGELHDCCKVQENLLQPDEKFQAEKKRETPVETEEQKAQCQQWLSEWSLD